MKRTTLASILYVALVFLSGVAVGGFAYRLYAINQVVAAKPDEYLRQYLDEMHSRLILSSDQMSQLSNIMATTKTRFHDVKAKWDKEAKRLRQPEMKAIQEDQIRQINGILSHDQQSEYEKLRVEREQRRLKTNAAKPPMPPGD
jgi:hypothetical protein